MDSFLRYSSDDFNLSVHVSDRDSVTKASIRIFGTWSRNGIHLELKVTAHCLTHLRHRGTRLELVIQLLVGSSIRVYGSSVPTTYRYTV